MGRSGGGRAKAHLQGGIIYTDNYIERHKATVRGIFSGITKPTPVIPLLSSFQLQEDLAIRKY